MSTPTPEQLTGMTPAEIDTLWAPLGAKLDDTIGELVGLERGLRTGKLTRWGAERAPARIAELETLKEQQLAAVAPFRDEWDRRGGWTRIFWCQANGGHAHSSTSCRSLQITTRMGWYPHLSGMDEAALVEMAGDSACTWCYPTAPRSRPSSLPDAVKAREEKAARAAELAEKRAAKDAKAIAMPDGSPLKVRFTEARTVVSAWREGSGALASLLWYGETHPSAPEWQRFAAMAAEALAHKLDRAVEDVAAELRAKAEAKDKRDRRAAGMPPR